MDTFIIILSTMGGVVANILTCTFLAELTKEKFFKDMLPIQVIIGAVFGLVSGAIIASQHLAILKWLVIPISGLGSLAVGAALWVVSAAIVGVCTLLAKFGTNLGKRFANRSGR